MSCHQSIPQSDWRCHGTNSEALWRDGEMLYQYNGRLVKSLPYLPHRHSKTVGMLRERANRYRWKRALTSPLRATYDCDLAKPKRDDSSFL